MLIFSRVEFIDTNSESDLLDKLILFTTFTFPKIEVSIITWKTEKKIKNTILIAVYKVIFELIEFETKISKKYYSNEFLV
jgi:hypothetical protein